MARAVGRHEPWWPLYRADRDALLLSRVRVSTVLIAPPVVGLTAYLSLHDPASSGLRVWFAVGFLALLAVACLMVTIPAGRRRALGVSLGFALGLTAVAAAQWRYTPQDIERAPLNAIAIMMGTTFLFPWGAGAQTVLGCATWLGYGWAALAAGRAPDYALGLMAGLIPLMGVGARLLERSRRASFARAWQSEQLASLARELAARVDEDALLARVLELGRGLLGADWGSAMMLLPSEESFKVAAIVGDAVDRSWVGIEPPAELAREILHRGHLVMPLEDPGNPLAAVLAQDGVHQALFTVMRHGDRVVGVLGFARRHPAPFTATDRSLARAIADQAAVALRTASLVADLRRANTLKSEFVSTMSHELRTPLNVILGFADMARDETLPAEERATCLRRIEAAGRDLLSLIDSTLEIGRFEANRDAVRLEPIDLRRFWNDLRAVCEQLRRHPAVRLEWDPDVPAVVVESDPRKLTVVLRNLVGNALKFTTTGQVDVLLRYDGRQIVITVRDTGIGIDPRDHATVFEMFRQADGSDTRRFGGTGLGLYIVRRFVEQLGGTVALESEPGAGATFVVGVPATVQRPASAAAA